MSAGKDYHKTIMCNVCGKVMRDNNFKRHTKRHQVNEDKQHGSSSLLEIMHRKSSMEMQDDSMNNVIVTRRSNGKNFEFELQRDNEVYKENVKYGEQISIILQSGTILEKSLSKQNKFCLELF